MLSSPPVARKEALRMTQAVVSLPPAPIFYPETDGQPMADNTKQLRWIFTLYGNLATLFRDHPDVFVGGNQFWYPVEGEPEIRMAPDVYVVFGRPKGDRSSYKQWEEGGIPMTVVFGVLSPGNTHPEMVDKHAFYEEYGAEEYYIYDPDGNRLLVYARKGEMLRRERQVAGFVSPRLGIRFDTSGAELVVFRPDGQPFLTFEDLQAERDRERAQRLTAEQRADQEKQRADRLAELSRKARRQQISPEELAELDRLEQPGTPPP
jgi:Uma2 family endonuclease